jgi:hypothetical protein
MTTIAYINGVMAADSGVWTGEASTSWADKLARGWDGSLHGCAGNAAESESYLQWVRDGMTGESPKPRSVPDGKDDRSSFIVLIAKEGELISLLTADGFERYDAPYFSIGAGSVAALAAMFCGAGARKAIKAAKAHASGAFGKVKSISVYE